MSALPSLSTAMINRQETTYNKCLGRGADAKFRQSDTGDISISLVFAGESNGEKVENLESSCETEMTGRTRSGLEVLRNTG